MARAPDYRSIPYWADVTSVLEPSLSCEAPPRELLRSHRQETSRWEVIQWFAGRSKTSKRHNTLRCFLLPKAGEQTRTVHLLLTRQSWNTPLSAKLATLLAFLPFPSRFHSHEYRHDGQTLPVVGNHARRDQISHLVNDAPLTKESLIKEPPTSLSDIKFPRTDRLFVSDYGHRNRLAVHKLTAGNRPLQRSNPW